MAASRLVVRRASYEDDQEADSWQLLSDCSHFRILTGEVPTRVSALPQSS